MKNGKNIMKRLLKFSEIVDEFGVTDWYWRSLVWKRELPILKMGKKILIDRNDIETFITKNKKVA